MGCRKRSYLSLACPAQLSLSLLLLVLSEQIKWEWEWEWWRRRRRRRRRRWRRWWWWWWWKYSRHSDKYSQSVLCVLSWHLFLLTLHSPEAIILPHRMIWSWYAGRWWVVHLVQRGAAWASCGPAQAPPRCTKCNSLPINGQCINHRIDV